MRIERSSWSSLALAALAALVTFTALVAAPPPAHACTRAPPDTKAWLPAADATAVPTNALIWISGGAEQVTLRPEVGISLPTTLTRMGQLVQAKPQVALAPSTRYTVEVITGATPASLSYSFTTGATEDLRVPPLPRSVEVTALQLPPGDGNSCTETGYRVGIEGQVGFAGTFYQLLVQRETGVEVIASSMSPLFSTVVSSLPSPTYSIRPIAITGLGASETQLPTGRAETSRPVPPANDGDDSERDDGGCSASTGSGASGGSSLALGAALLGLALRPRRRRG